MVTIQTTKTYRNQSHGLPLNIFNIASKKTNNQQIEQNEENRKKKKRKLACVFINRHTIASIYGTIFCANHSFCSSAKLETFLRHSERKKRPRLNTITAFASQFTHNALRHTLTPVDKIVRYATWKFYVFFLHPLLQICFFFKSFFLFVTFLCRLFTAKFLLE